MKTASRSRLEPLDAFAICEDYTSPKKRFLADYQIVFGRLAQLVRAPR